MNQRIYTSIVVGLAVWLCLGSSVQAQVTFTPHVISSSQGGAAGVSVADLDGDGDLDVLSTAFDSGLILWHENDGTATFATHTIATEEAGAVMARAVDLDGDGDLDVISAAFEGDRVAWHENDGNQGFTSHAIITREDGMDGARSVVAADVDGDGDVDVLSANARRGSVAWHENDGDENFSHHIVSTDLSNPRSVRAADMDGDGDTDVLAGSFFTNRFLWFENDGEETFTPHVITAAATGAITVEPRDVDGDGDMDVLGAAAEENEIAWYENDGSQAFTRHVITKNARFASWVEAADLDDDGDVDVLSASRFDNKIAWYENNGAETFTAHVITTEADTALTVAAADLDGDGDVDVLATSWGDDEVLWFENVVNLQKGTDLTFDVATWNIQTFGFPGFGPSDEARQFRHVLDVMRKAEIDLWAVQEMGDESCLPEVVDESCFEILIDSLAGYEGVTGSVLGENGFVRVGFVYKTDVVERLSSVNILIADQEMFSDRPPLRLHARATVAGHTMEVYVITVHMQARAGQAEHDRREAAGRLLKEYIDTQLPDAHVLVMGDFNDELRHGITGAGSPYAEWVADPTYRFLTLPLDERNEGTFLPRGSTIDHIVVNESMARTYIEGSTERFLELTEVIPSYSSTTSDHLPVVARFDLARTSSAEEVAPTWAVRMTAAPNPFYDQATVTIERARPGPARIDVFDLLGRRQAVLFDGYLLPEARTFRFDAGDLPGGVYLVRLQTASGTEVRPLVRVR